MITGAAAWQTGTSHALPAASPRHADREQKMARTRLWLRQTCRHLSGKDGARPLCLALAPQSDQAMHERHLQVGEMPAELLWWQGPQSFLGQRLYPQVPLWFVLQRRRRVTLLAQGQPWLAQLPVWWLPHLMRGPGLALPSQAARWCLLQLVGGALLAEGWML